MRKKIKKKNPIKFPSELRLDLASGDWVVIATGRARRPETFKKEKKERKRTGKKNCPFCKINTQEVPSLVSVEGELFYFQKWQEVPKNWTVIVIPNKYPAFLPYKKLDKKTEGGLYQKINAAGFHEVVVTRDHNKQMAQFSVKKIKEVFDVYQRRYLDLMDKKFVNYISIFHNQGPKAGASIVHPHSQIITTPLVDVDLKGALLKSENYFRKHKECIYCKMNKWEKKVKKRIVFENNDFLVVCPFASKTAFQVIVSPKKHSAYFEEIDDKEKWSLAEAFQSALRKIYNALNDPDYNFYLHTAPCDDKKYDHYHWHWTILPKTGTWAGFEIGTRMEISTIEPEKAAAYLRKH